MFDIVFTFARRCWKKKANFIEKVNVWFIDTSESLVHLQDLNLLTVFSVTY